MFEINHQLTIANVEEIINKHLKLKLSETSRFNVIKAFEFVENKIKNTDELFYGINTGFGSLCNKRIDNAQLQDLQYNLLRSHACGTGSFAPKTVVKLMLLLKIQSLSYGYSGVNISTIEQLIKLYNADILPVVYEQGSLGASGDLAPLAHLSLPLIGEGKVWQNNEIIDASEALKKLGITPISLNAKEGLALINGTQFMAAYAVLAILKTNRINAQLSKISAVSIDAFDAKLDPFYLPIHQIRKQKGQEIVASDLLDLLKDSNIAQQEKKQVQDPYSFRCIPQVHGASFDAIEYCNQVFENEINSVTDNPNIFVDDDKIMSGGNFHGQALALSLDFMAIAVSELASISERRIYKLIGGERGLPAYLTQNAGLESGLMVVQYTAASIVSQNKQLCTPASVDSIVSSNGQEDHVSMGANAATKLLKVIENTEQVLGLEMLVASRALRFKRPLKSSPKIEDFCKNFNEQLNLPDTDCILSPYLLASKTILFN